MSDGRPGGSEPIITSGERKKRPVDFITIAAVLVVVAVIVGNVVKQQQAAPTTQVEEQAPQTETPSTPTPESEEPPATIPSSFIQPDAFEHRAKAEEIINSTQGKTVAAGTWEQIVYGVVADEADPERVYFATSQNNPAGNFVGIYQYNTRTYQWQRFYKNAYIPSSDESAKRLHILGKDGRNLIVAFDTMRDILEPCESAWLEGETLGLKSLNLDTPLDGLKDYALPSALREQEEAKVAECLAQ